MYRGYISRHHRRKTRILVASQAFHYWCEWSKPLLNLYRTFRIFTDYYFCFKTVTAILYMNTSGLFGIPGRTSYMFVNNP